VNHVIAILAFAVFCAVWFALQRWAGADSEAPCDGCQERGCARLADPTADGQSHPGDSALRDLEERNVGRGPRSA